MPTPAQESLVMTTLRQRNKGKYFRTSRIRSDVKAQGHSTSVTQPNKLTSSRRSVSWAQRELTASEINKRGEANQVRCTPPGGGGTPRKIW